MLITQHCKCLPWGSLAIHEDRTISAPEWELIDDSLAALGVYLFVGVHGPECMIVHKLVPIASLDCIGEGRSLFMPGSLEWVINIDIFSQDMRVVHWYYFVVVVIDLPNFLILEFL